MLGPTSSDRRVQISAGIEGPRVAIDAHVLDGKYQGSRTWLHEMLLRIPSLLPSVTFLVYSYNPHLHQDEIPQSNVHHEKIPENCGSIRRLLYFWPLELRRKNIDLLMTQYFSPPYSGRQQMVVIHDVLFESHPHFFPFLTRWRNRIFVRVSARHASQVITVSRYSRDEIVRRYRPSSYSVGIVRNGVDIDFWARKAVMSGRIAALVSDPYILFVGRLEPRKNLSVLLDALEKLGRENLQLVIVGRNDFENSEVLRRVRSDPRVLQLEDVEPSDLAALYQGAAVFVFPSLGEGWGIPILEALAAGTTVIASSTTAIPEAGGAVCHYFDPLESDPATSLMELIRASLDHEMDEKIELRDYHVRSFTWDRSAIDLARLIADNLQRSRR